jgi:ferrous iron transport protein B
MYVKKAGTVILAISILLWALMTFPVLPEERVREFDLKQEILTRKYLSKPIVETALDSSMSHGKVFKEIRDIIEADGALNMEDMERLEHLLESLEKGNQGTRALGSGFDRDHFIEVSNAYLSDIRTLENRMRTERLKYTLGGRIGMALEYLFSPIGFEWKTCIALVGGFAAKEVVVSTLGTAYSLGEVDPESGSGLSERLKKTPGWNPLKAFSLIMFVMLYAPCFVTLVVIKKETGSWKWTLFAVVYTTTLAYLVALMVKMVGTFLGFGTT